MHFDSLDALALAGLAAAALDVEGKAPRLVPSDPGLAGHCVELADVVEDVGIGGRVRPRRAADGRLVDLYDAVDSFRAGDAAVRAGLVLGVMEPSPQGLVEYLGNERALARPGDPGYARKNAERELHVDALEVVLAGFFDLH